MAIQLINTGTGANKGDGESLRSAFTKINNNFTELTNYLGSTVTDFTEIVEDVVGSMFIHGDHTVGGIKVDYNDTSSKIIINLITPEALVPPSGTTGTVLTKNSTASYDLTWTSLISLVGPTGPTGPGPVFIGAWNSATIYAENEIVSYSGGSYISTGVNYNSIPTDLTDWDILALPGAIGPQGPAGPVGPSFLNVGSTDSHTIINSGELVFFTTYTGAFVIGGRIRAVAASTTSNWVEGNIIDLVADSRINIIADHSNGSGTYDLWNITVAGHPGTEGTVGPTGPEGPQGPGADQELNTTSSVIFQSIGVTTGLSVTKTLSIGGMPIDGDGHVHILNTLTQSPLMIASNYVGGVRPEIVIRGYGGNRPEGLINTTGLSGIILESSRGTEELSTALQQNDGLGYLGFTGYDTNRWGAETNLPAVVISGYATETWNGNTNTTFNAGAGMFFRTQPNGVQLTPASRQIWLQTAWQNGTDTDPPQQIVRIGNASQTTPTLLTSDGQHFHTSFGATNIEYINVRSKIIGVPDEDHSDFDGDINGITLNVTTLNSGTISIGQRITGTNILTATFILSTGTGVGGTGTYFVSKSQTVSSTNIRGGSDNNTLQSTNGLTFITGRKSGVNGRRSALKKDDTIFNIVGKAQFLEFVSGEGAKVADLRFRALENYTTSTRGSKLVIETVNSGTTATSIRLDLSDQEHKYRSDRHYFTATNATLTNVVVEGHVLPSADNAFDLGTSSTQWRSLYVGTSTIYIGGKALSVTPAGEITVDGSPIGGGGGGGTTSTLTAGTATLSINTLSETVLPSGLKFEPIENYGFGFGGTIAMQTYGEQLQMLATGTGAFGLFGYGEVIGGPGGVAYLVGNQDGTNEVKIVAGSYTATVNTWEFKNNGDLIIPNAILGSGNQALVVQNTASGVAYLQLPVDPSTDSVILANQAASSATVTIRVGDFGSEKNWTFDEFGALATPGIIYNTDTSNVGQLLLAGAPGEPATYLALPSDVGSTSMNVRLANSNGDIQLSASNSSWLFNSTGELTLPNGSMLFESSLIAASGTNAVLSQFDSNTQVYTMDYAVGVQTHNSGTYHTWLFNDTGDLELPGGSVLATSGYDVALVAGNDSSSTFGSVTISTQYPSDLTDRNWEFNSLGEFYLPLGGAIQETVVTNELWGTTTTSLTLVPAGAANGTQRLEIYSTAGGEGDHIHITSGDQNQTDLFLGNDTQYFSVGAMGQMEVRARPGLASPSPGTGAYAGSPVWIYAGDAGDNGGNTADGASGGDILLQAGISTANAVGGSVYLQSASGPAGFGSIKLSTDNGSTYLEFDKDDTLTFPSGGDIVFDSSATSYIYGVTGIEFADATTQTTAFTGTSALLDITNTNGIDTTYYLTFVENRTAGQEVRADVDLTWNSWSNTLGVGKVSVNSTAGSTSTTTGALTVAGGVGIQGDLWAGNIYSNGIQLTAGGGGGGGVTSITAGTGTNVSSTTGNITIWVGNTSNLEETFESKTTATGVVVHDCTTNRLFYHTGATGNITPNFTNLGLAAGEATSISLVVVQGGTARNVSGVQIAGTTTGVTLVWQGSASAPSGNANRTDVFSFSILCTATNAYTVLGMLTSFGGI